MIKEKSSKIFELWPYQIIHTAKLSPDGYYALLLTHSFFTNGMREKHLFLVRLEDMAIKEIENIDANTIQVGIFTSKYKPIIEWNNDVLFILTEDGVQTFKFQFE